KVKRWPASALMSPGMSQRATSSGSVSARHTLAGGWARNSSSRIAVRSSAIVVLHLVEKRAQAGQLLAPESLVRDEPVAQPQAPFALPPVLALAALARLAHQARAVEDLEVLRHAGAAHVEPLGQAPGGLGALLQQQAEQLAPGRAGERGE